MKIDSILKNYVNESYTEEEADELIKILRRDCKEYYKWAKKIHGFRIFRASTEHFTGYKKIIPRKDRKPRDLNIKLHEKLDKMFYKKFKWNVRSEGVFAQMNSANRLEAYGKIYYLFPIGDFEVVGNPHIDDLYFQFLEDGIMDNNKNLYVDIDSKEYNEYFQEIVDDYITDVEKLFYESVEISIKADAYYLVDQDLIKTKYWSFIKG